MTPRFENVPDHWKHPEGPYRKAPPEYGGEWWLVNPFASPNPWLTQSRAATQEALPAGFEGLFGARPQAADFRSTPNPSLFFRMALVQWEQDLRHFDRAGVPEWATAESMSAAEAVFRAWQMGAPRYYLGRYGWSARFPESPLPSFDADARSAIESTHLMVARFQMAMVEDGKIPERKHPFVPPHIWPGETNELEEETDATN